MAFDNMSIACLSRFWFVVIALHHWTDRFKIFIIFLKSLSFISLFSRILHLLTVSFKEVLSCLPNIIPILSSFFKMLNSILQLPLFLSHSCDIRYIRILANMFFKDRESISQVLILLCQLEDFSVGIIKAFRLLLDLFS